MNKKLLAMAVSAAVLAPAFASADVTVYGRLQAEYNIEDTDGGESLQGVDDANGQSRLGVKFSEKLGGGLTAFGKVEFRLDPSQHSTSATSGNSTGATGALGERDAHVGIKGSWGSIAAGSFHAPYKTAGGVKWDPWTATHLQARRAGGMTGGAGIGGHNGFMRNALYYTSPNVNGFQLHFAISPDETNTGANNGDDDGDNDYSLALQYKNGPWHAIVAHNRNNRPDSSAFVQTGVTTFTTGISANFSGNLTAPFSTTIGGTVNLYTTITGVPTGYTTSVSNKDETLTKVGLRWKSGAITLAGQYEWVRDAKAVGGKNANGLVYDVADGADGEVLWLNGQYKAGNNIFSLSYGNTDVDVDGSGDYDIDYWAVGMIHKFSKKTRIFGGYTETDSSSNYSVADKDAWTVGIRADF